MDWKARHKGAIAFALRTCNLDSAGRALITVIGVILAIAILWRYAGPNEALSEVLAKGSTTAAIVLIFPLVYLWDFLAIGSLIRRNMAVLLMIVGSLLAIVGAVMFAVGILQSRMMDSRSPQIARLEGQLTEIQNQLAGDKISALQNQLAGIAPQLEKFETSLGNVQRLAERAVSPDPTAQILARQVKLKDLIPRTTSAIDNLVKIDTVFREGVTSQNDPPDRPGQTKGNTIRSYRLTWYKPIEALALLAKQVDGRSFDQAVSETDMHAKVPGEEAFGDGTPDAVGFRKEFLLRRNIQKQAQSMLQEMQAELDQNAKKLLETPPIAKLE